MKIDHGNPEIFQVKVWIWGEKCVCHCKNRDPDSLPQLGFLWRQQRNDSFWIPGLARISSCFVCVSWQYNIPLLFSLNLQFFVILFGKDITYTMVNRCVVGGCSNTNKDGVTCHRFPKEKSARQKWERFVQSTRKNWKCTDHSIICGAHFVVPDDFENFMQWEMGFKSKLELKKTAIPSITPSKVTKETVQGSRPIAMTAGPRKPASQLDIPVNKPRVGAVHKLTVARVNMFSRCSYQFLNLTIWNVVICMVFG